MPAIEARSICLPEFGISTRVLEAGSGPVVLMLHGNPDNADEWALLMGKLRRSLSMHRAGFSRLWKIAGAAGIVHLQP